MPPKKKPPTLPKTVGELTPAPYNPRKISEVAGQGLDISLREFGDLSGLTYNLRTGNLVTGHQRQTKLPPDSPIVDYREAADDVGTVGYGYVQAKTRRYALRVVDWDEIKEKAANVSANNPNIQGEYTPLLAQLLQEIEADKPDVFDQTLMAQLLGKGTGVSTDEDDEDKGEFDLAPQPYESYNYVVLFFRNEIDWTAAVDHFKLKRVKEGAIKKSRIGLGCAIDGAAYINKLRSK